MKYIPQQPTPGFSTDDVVVHDSGITIGRVARIESPDSCPNTDWIILTLHDTAQKTRGQYCTRRAAANALCAHWEGYEWHPETGYIN